LTGPRDTPAVLLAGEAKHSALQAISMGGVMCGLARAVPSCCSVQACDCRRISCRTA